jgi:hypothetical protein
MIDVAVEALVAEQSQKLLDLMEADLPITAVDRSGTTVFVTFTHPKNGRMYVLRFRCDGFPLTPASTHFVNPQTHEDTGPDVWPTDGEQAIKTTSNPRFLCLPGTREYHAAHGTVIPEVHSLSLAVIFQHVVQALELRG